MSSASALEAIKKFDQSFSAAGLEYYLWGGAILGFHRDGKLIENYSDPYFAVPFRTRGQLLIVRKLLEGSGFSLKTVFEDPQREGIKFEFAWKDSIININVLYPLTFDRSWYSFYEFKDESTVNVIMLWERAYNLKRHTVGDVSFVAPAEVEAHLEMHFGKDWKTPKKEYHPVKGAKNIILQYEIKSKDKVKKS